MTYQFNLSRVTKFCFIFMQYLIIVTTSSASFNAPAVATGSLTGVVIDAENEKGLGWTVL